MKKILHLILLLGFSSALFSQTCDDSLPVVENFDDSSVIGVCWNLEDQDGDGYDWYWRDYGPVYGNHKCLTSRSWNSGQGNLNPDNWIISHAIDLTGNLPSETIELSWKVRAENATLAHEYYTVYAATGNQIVDFESSSVSRGEFTDEVGAAGAFVTRTLDVSSLAGNTIYVAFRHQNIAGSQFIINIDDVELTNQSLGVDDVNANSITHYYNSLSEDLVIKANNSQLSTISIYNLLGQDVLQVELIQSEEHINLSNLKDGVYIGRVTANGSQNTFKFIKS